MADHAWWLGVLIALPGVAGVLTYSVILIDAIWDENKRRDLRTDWWVGAGGVILIILAVLVAQYSADLPWWK